MFWQFVIGSLLFIAGGIIAALLTNAIICLRVGIPLTKEIEMLFNIDIAKPKKRFIKSAICNAITIAVLVILAIKFCSGYQLYCLGVGFIIGLIAGRGKMGFNNANLHDFLRTCTRDIDSQAFYTILLHLGIRYGYEVKEVDDQEYEYFKYGKK